MMRRIDGFVHQSSGALGVWYRWEMIDASRRTMDSELDDAWCCDALSYVYLYFLREGGSLIGWCVGKDRMKDVKCDGQNRRMSEHRVEIGCYWSTCYCVLYRLDTSEFVQNPCIIEPWYWYCNQKLNPYCCRRCNNALHITVPVQVPRTKDIALMRTQCSRVHSPWHLTHTWHDVGSHATVLQVSGTS